MSAIWAPESRADKKHPPSNPVITDFFGQWSNQALGELRLWLEDFVPPPASTDGFIRFDTYPQAGDYLYVETTDETSAPNGWGMEFLDTTTVTSFGVHVASNKGRVTVEALAHDLALNSRGGKNIFVESYGTGYIWIGTIETNTVTIGRSACTIDIDGDTVSIDANAGNLNLNANTAGNDVMMKLSGTGAGDRFQIRNSAGNVLLEVRGDGTFHIETGAAWVADL